MLAPASSTRGAEFLTAQGVFHDLERNVQVTMEVRRRITGKNGRRYSSDMIGVTGNAACSIALRNAVFRGIPRAFWIDIYDAARKAAVGDAQTLANKRAHMFAHFLKLGAPARRSWRRSTCRARRTSGWTSSRP